MSDTELSAEKWLQEVLLRHERLTKSVEALITNVLRSREIEYLSVTGRTKDINSALENIERKSYNNPMNQLTDLSGLRVITYFESQVSQVCYAIKKLFSIDKNKCR
jgi:putative GTP pyrophosphokinase